MHRYSRPTTAWRSGRAARGAVHELGRTGTALDRDPLVALAAEHVAQLGATVDEGAYVVQSDHGPQCHSLRSSGKVVSSLSMSLARTGVPVRTMTVPSGRTSNPRPLRQ